jgi:hypothetical protein
VVVASPPIVISGPMKDSPPAPAFARAGLAALVCWVRENMSGLPLLARRLLPLARAADAPMLIATPAPAAGQAAKDDAGAASSDGIDDMFPTASRKRANA